MDRIKTINKLLELTKEKNYLEIGVFRGTCITKIKANKLYGVDPFPSPIFTLRKNFNNIKFYEMTSDDFFKNEIKKINLKFDVIFIDGLHTHEQSLKDVINSLENLNTDGFIVLHDCNPTTKIMAIPANSFDEVKNANKNNVEWTKEWCGDVWKTIVLLRTQRSDLDICVFNYDYGVGIIQKKPSKKLELNINTENLTYEDLNRNRKELLNLKEEKEFETFLNEIKTNQNF